MFLYAHSRKVRDRDGEHVRHLQWLLFFSISGQGALGRGGTVLVRWVKRLSACILYRTRTGNMYELVYRYVCLHRSQRFRFFLVSFWNTDHDGEGERIRDNVDSFQYIA